MTTEQDLAIAAFPANRLVIAPFAAADQLSEDPVTALTAGTSRLGWPAAALFLTCVLAIGAWAGRVESAIYRATGTSRLELTLMEVLRWLLLALLAVPSGAALGLLAASLSFDTGHAPANVWFLVQPSTVLGLLVPVIGPAVSLAGTLGSVVDSLQD